MYYHMFSKWDLEINSFLFLNRDGLLFLNFNGSLFRNSLLSKEIGKRKRKNIKAKSILGTMKLKILANLNQTFSINLLKPSNKAPINPTERETNMAQSNL